MGKKRLDVLLVEHGLMESRQKAQAVIMAGQVFSGERRCDKPGLIPCRERQLRILALPQGDSPTVCCKMVRRKYML